jgi:hypothetical protein
MARSRSGGASARAGEGAKFGDRTSCDGHGEALAFFGPAEHGCDVVAKLALRITPIFEASSQNCYVADHAMQTLGAQAWDEREGMIDLFLDAARSAPISQELALNFIAQHVLGLPSHR